MLNAYDFSDSKALRQALRQLRRALSNEQQTLHAQQIAKQLNQLLPLKASSLALYNAFDGEPDTRAIAALTTQPIAYPLVSNDDNSMRFAYGDAETLNRFGIKEATQGESVSLENLDAIIVPLVGFDKQCNRIGMGAGFYDRLLAGLSDQRPRPLFIGIAHSCQQVNCIGAQPWDIPMDHIITETQVHSR